MCVCVCTSNAYIYMYVYACLIYGYGYLLWDTQKWDIALIAAVCNHVLGMQTRRQICIYASIEIDVHANGFVVASNVIRERDRRGLGDGGRLERFDLMISKTTNG